MNHNSSHQRPPRNQIRLRETIQLLFAIALFGHTPAFGEDLPIIGVTEIKAPVDDPHFFSRVNTKANNFQVMLETQLLQVGRFKIIERSRIDDVLGEQLLNRELGDSRTAGGGFHVEGVDYLVYGSITKFGQSREDFKTGGFSSSKLITEFAADIRVVDASNGEIRKAETAEVRLETAGGNATRDFSSASGAGDPLAEAQRLAAKKMAAIIATSIFPIEVVRGGDVIYVNYGEAILDVGDTLTAFRPGEELIDERSGVNLGAEEIVIGKIQISEVTDKFSKAELVEGKPPMAGDLLRLSSKASESSDKGGTQGEKRGREI